MKRDRYLYSACLLVKEFGENLAIDGLEFIASNHQLAFMAAQYEQICETYEAELSAYLDESGLDLTNRAKCMIAVCTFRRERLDLLRTRLAVGKRLLQAIHQPFK